MLDDFFTLGSHIKLLKVLIYKVSVITVGILHMGIFFEGFVRNV